MLNKITKGKIIKPPKIVIYGLHGVGKSTFASEFEKPLFISTEDGTGQLDIDRIELEKYEQWSDLMTEINLTQDFEYKTIVIDTLDWMESIIAKSICARNNKSNLSDFGYGAGVKKLEEEFSKFVDSLTWLHKRKNVTIVCIAHSQIKKFNAPDEMQSHDIYDMKIRDRNCPVIKEWADFVGFMRFKDTIIENKEGKSKAVGGVERIIHTRRTPVFDVKTRYEMPPVIKAEYKELIKYIKQERKQ